MIFASMVRALLKLSPKLVNPFKGSPKGRFIVGLAVTRTFSGSCSKGDVQAFIQTPTVIQHKYINAFLVIAYPFYAPHTRQTEKTPIKQSFLVFVTYIVSQFLRLKPCETTFFTYCSLKIASFNKHLINKAIKQDLFKI
jgi:hypothetical protein